MDLKWMSDDQVFKLAGNSKFPVLFDNIEYEWEDEGPNSRVESLIRVLLHEDGWKRTETHDVLRTEFELLAFGNTRYGSKIILAGDLQDPEYASGVFEPFGYVDFDNGSGSSSVRLQESYYQSLIGITRMISRPVRCDAEVRLVRSADGASQSLDSIEVFLPATTNWDNPSLCSYRPGGSKYSGQTETPSFSEYSASNAEYSLIWNDSDMEMTILPYTTHYGSYHMDGFQDRGLKRHLEASIPEEEVYIELSLVPDYSERLNPPRIAVNLINSPDNTELDSRIGFLPKTNAKLGTLLVKMSRYTGGRYRCYGLIDRDNNAEQCVRILLPYEKKLIEDLETFLEEQQREYSENSCLRVPARRVDKFRAAALESLSFATSYEGVEAIDFVTGNSGYDTVRSLNIKNSRTNKLIGSIQHGMLLLDDERHRGGVGRLVKEAGIDFKDAIPEFLPEVNDEFLLHMDAIPNVEIRKYPRWILFESKNRTFVRERLNLGEYNPESQELWVQDEAIAHSLSRAAARHGIPVSEVCFPSTPWFLEEQVHYTKRRDYSDSSTDREVGGIVLGRDIDEEGRELGLTESLSETLLREKYLGFRSDLFPEHAAEPDLLACRLCKEPALKFSVSFCPEALAYCHFCFEKAARGRPEPERDRVLELIKALADVEFDGVPPMSYQLSTINALGRKLIAARDIDRMMQLRGQFRSSDWSWIKLLGEGGLLEAGVRTGRGIAISAADGHLCRSLLEKVVDDFFFYHKVPHDLEPAYPLDEDLNPTARKRADWLLEDGTFVEMWGLHNDPVYETRMIEKKALAAKHRIPLIGLLPRDLNSLPEIFSPWLSN